MHASYKIKAHTQLHTYCFDKKTQTDRQTDKSTTRQKILCDRIEIHEPHPCKNQVSGAPDALKLHIVASPVRGFFAFWGLPWQISRTVKEQPSSSSTTNSERTCWKPQLHLSTMLDDFLGSISQTFKDHHLINKVLLPPPLPSYDFDSFPQDELIIIQTRSVELEFSLSKEVSQHYRRWSPYHTR
jgi:hypothetical protein